MDIEQSFKELLIKIEDLGKRIAVLDTNGKLGEIQKEMKIIAANSQIVVNTVKTHGTAIKRIETIIEKLQFHCPLLNKDFE